MQADLAVSLDRFAHETPNLRIRGIARLGARRIRDWLTGPRQTIQPAWFRDPRPGTGLKRDRASR